ncbi:MAG: hypothetical protein V1913_18810 [Fibrobacterota bacterium]
MLLAAFLLLTASLTFSQIPAVPAQPKVEKFGFKDVPFGVPKDALVRQLCIRFGFKQTSALKRKNFSDLKLQELITLPGCCYSKYLLAKDTVEARWIFNSEEKFSELQFRTALPRADNTPDNVRLSAEFFNTLFEAKYGPAASKNEVNFSALDSAAITPYWAWSKAGAAIQTGFLADKANYYAVASVALPR